MSSKVRPIKPDEVAKEKERNFPNVVVESFNELIAQKFNGRSATVSQGDVEALMVQKGLDRQEIYAKGWMNVEEVYRSAGWIVTYDRPAYNESYPATFTFKRPQKSE